MLQSIVKKPVRPQNLPDSPRPQSVFVATRTILTLNTAIPKGLHLNQRMKMDGLKFLAKLEADPVPIAFFASQYHGVLDKLMMWINLVDKKLSKLIV